MNLDHIVPYILTLNEQNNISKCLDALQWANEVVVIDSYSEDATVDIARSYSNVKLLQRKFNCHSKQHNFALEQILNSKWVLRLDADWLVTKLLLSEIETLSCPPFIGAYKIPFRFSIYGEIIPINLYPPAMALFKRDGAYYVQDGHTERLVPNGDIFECNACLIHEDKKPIDSFLSSQANYSKLEAEKIIDTPSVHAHWKTKIRKQAGLAPIFMAFYLLILKGGVFRGPAVRHYILQKIIAESILSLRILDKKLRKNVD